MVVLARVVVQAPGGSSTGYLRGEGRKRNGGVPPRRRGRTAGGGAGAKGGAGKPVNSCTMARKLEMSVVSTVVGGRRDARGRFRGGLRAAADDEPGAGGRGSSEVVAGKKEQVAGSRKSGRSSRKAEAGAAGDDGGLSLAVEAMLGGERKGVDGDVGFGGEEKGWRLGALEDYMSGLVSC